MEVVDAQVHTWGPNHVNRPWDPNFGNGDARASALRAAHAAHSVTVAETIEAMAEAGVDAALIASTAIYGYDNGYALEAAANYPSKFGVFGHIDPAAPDVDERVAVWRRKPGALGFRVVVANDSSRDELRAGVFDPIFKAAERHRVPLCIYMLRLPNDVGKLAQRFPDLSLTFDHLGLPQPPLAEPDEDIWQLLPAVLDLARYPNVSVKLTAAPTLSRQDFPYADLWPRIHQFLEAFGLDRVMWGSDWTRPEVPGTYRESVAYILDTDELTDSDKALLMGKTLRRTFDWPAPP
jgi:L-fuconolactonase